MGKNCWGKTLLPYFCKKNFNGSKSKIKGYILDPVLYFGHRAGSCHHYPFLVFDPDHPICLHLFCAGHGYHLALNRNSLQASTLACPPDKKKPRHWRGSYLKYPTELLNSYFTSSYSASVTFSEPWLPALPAC